MCQMEIPPISVDKLIATQMDKFGNLEKITALCQPTISSWNQPKIEGKQKILHDDDDA